MNSKRALFFDQTDVWLWIVQCGWTRFVLQTHKSMEFFFIWWFIAVFIRFFPKIISAQFSLSGLIKLDFAMAKMRIFILESFLKLQLRAKC